MIYKQILLQESGENVYVDNNGIMVRGLLIRVRIGSRSVQLKALEGILSSLLNTRKQPGVIIGPTMTMLRTMMMIVCRSWIVLSTEYDSKNYISVIKRS